MRYQKALIAVLLTAVAGTAYADNCNHPRNSFDGLYCLNKVYAQADRDLTVAYKDLRARLKPAARETLKKTEIRWIDARDSQCSWHHNGGFFVNLRCATDMTVQRTNFLNDRIRECKATGCQPSQLR